MRKKTEVGGGGGGGEARKERREEGKHYPLVKWEKHLHVIVKTIRIIIVRQKQKNVKNRSDNDGL